MRPRLHFNADRVYSFRVTLSKNVMPHTLLRRGIWKRLGLRNGECPQSPSVQTLKRHRSQHGHRSSAKDCEKKRRECVKIGRPFTPFTGDRSCCTIGIRHTTSTGSKRIPYTGSRTCSGYSINYAATRSLGFSGFLEAYDWFEGILGTRNIPLLLVRGHD